jgi:hypothetical protein
MPRDHSLERALLSEPGPFRCWRAGLLTCVCADEGKIIEYKVLVRPLKAVNLIHQKMAAMLQAK